jgi:ATP-dependent helicase/nuclease subunit A
LSTSTQDINAAQDSILEAISRDGADANRFLVGDVKQSIYRFRLANPRIFQSYVRSWKQTVALVDNFRSRPGILRFVNSVFSLIMRPEIGGLGYDRSAQLRAGEPRPEETTGSCVGGPCIELHLLTSSNQRPDKSEPEQQLGASDLEEITQTESEARLIAGRIAAVVQSAYPVWDEKAKSFRPVEYGDIAVLLRSPSRKAESYAKEFSRAGVPLLVARGGFYSSLEISDLLCLLHLLDNPLQDIPAVAVLRSPLVGLSVNDLARIRLAAKGRYWTAINRWHRSRQKLNKSAADKTTTNSANAEEAELFAKIDSFLSNFARWRRLARQSSLSRCLDVVLSDTAYAEWLMTQPRGGQLCANVNRLVALARQFDRFQRQSLFRFLTFVEGQQVAEAEPEFSAIETENAVRLISIHQSKGLEFPVVVLADIGKAFNETDLRADIILDEQFGLCPLVKPPHTGTRYPSLPYWLARRRQRRELLGEELRLLYVGMTRARDLLLLCGSIPSKRWQKLSAATAGINAAQILAARSYADWLGLWFWKEVKANPGRRVACRRTSPGLFTTTV